MQKKFAEALNGLRGLIKEWSAPLCPTELAGGSPSVLLAVSGGIDSMCMAELFSSMEHPVPFAVAHCNFRLRGEESDGDEALVRRWAEEHNVPFHNMGFDTEEYASANGISVEMAARDLRYGWFADICRQYGYVAVSVAHNANDNAETLMLNMLRGSGLNGLAGMSLLSEVPGTSVPLIRPMLAFTRKQIEGYMLAHRVKYREDSTNASSEYKRNRIRNEVFPIFENINPSFVRTLNREMGYFSEAGDIVGEWCEAKAGAVLLTAEAPAVAAISLQALLSVRHWRYLLYHLLEPFGFNSATLASVENLLASDRTVSGKRFEAAEYILLTQRDRLVVVPSEDIMKDCPASSYIYMSDPVMSIPGPGTYHFNGRAFRVELLPKTDDMPLKQPEGVIMMDADRLRFPFLMRLWQNGDWLVPLGMRGKKKVSDLFADLKYDSFRKNAAVVIGDAADESCDCQHIAALACIRIDNSYRISGLTESILRISEIL